MSDIAWEFSAPRWPYPSYIQIKSNSTNFAMRGVDFEHEAWRAERQIERIRNEIKTEIECALKMYFLVSDQDAKTLAAKIHFELLEFYKKKGVNWEWIPKTNKEIE
jgi:hypothetical protein